MMELDQLMGAPIFKTNRWAQSSPYQVSPFIAKGWKTSHWIPLRMVFYDCGGGHFLPSLEKKISGIWGLWKVPVPITKQPVLFVELAILVSDRVSHKRPSLKAEIPSSNHFYPPCVALSIYRQRQQQQQQLIVDEWNVKDRPYQALS